MSKPQRILIVDDDPSVCVSLALLLKQQGYVTQTADGPEAALLALSQQPADLVLQDMNFSRRTCGEDGLQLLKRLREQHPSLPVLLMTAWGSIELAVAGVKAGAQDFFTKPWDNAQLLARVHSALHFTRPAPITPREQLATQGQFEQLIGEHPAFLQVLSTLTRIADTRAPVLILGESGTGKEQVAKAIHQNSSRRQAAFVAVNMGAVPSTLFESEMFGHVRGAFTDAKQDRRGHFSMAEGGSLFLDEIGELPRADQAKLLRVLQEQEYQPVGANQSRRADVRIISATNQELASEVAEGRFREDLWYRLNLITLRLPALRERSTDIPLLAAHFLHALGAEYGLHGLRLSADAERHLCAQNWPGNIRELRQTLTRTALLSQHSLLTRADFQAASSQLGKPPLAETDSTPADGESRLDATERQLIQRTLVQCQHNIAQAAKQLGISRPALYRRMEKFKLDADPSSS